MEIRSIKGTLAFLQLPRDLGSTVCYSRNRYYLQLSPLINGILGSHTFNMVFHRIFQSKKKEREERGEPVAASRRQSQAELRKDGLKSRSGCSGQMEGRCVSAGCAERKRASLRRAHGIKRLVPPCVPASPVLRVFLSLGVSLSSLPPRAMRPGHIISLCGQVRAETV